MDTVTKYQKRLSPTKRMSTSSNSSFLWGFYDHFFQIVNYSRDEGREKMQSCNPQGINREIRLSSP